MISRPEPEPIRVGMMYDYPVSDPNDLKQSFEMALNEAVESGLVDRRIEIVECRTKGLPNGSYRAVRDGFDHLVEQNCLIIFAQLVSDNAAPLARHVDAVAEVPLIHMGGSESALGEFMFELNNGSMTEEPMIICSVMKYDGHRRIAVTEERSLLGEEYLAATRVAARRLGLEIVGEFSVPQIESEKDDVIRDIRQCTPDALIHVGFGHGLLAMNEALQRIDWELPRYTTTAFEFAHLNQEWAAALAGWKGLDSYDERNTLGQEVLQRYTKKYRVPRSGPYVPCFGYDAGQVVSHALADARPLTGPGVKEALERIKMLPAASGAPGTMLRFGRYIRQGWMGSEYLVVRRILPDGKGHVIHGTIKGLVDPVETPQD